MTEVRFYSAQEVDDSLLKFVVTAARFHDQWVFSRHRERSTWDMPGGHREAGESVDEAAARELWEETGAEKAKLNPVCVYSVTKNGETKYGMLYFAEIEVLRNIPEGSEMAEVLLTDKFLENPTYPDILPKLFEKIQGWRNLQSSADELWDVYDGNRNRTGKLHRRGDPLGRGEYHLVVHIWMQNANGEFLLTKRSPNKGFPNMWESTGGSALAGDSSLTAALREVREETGLELDPERGRMVMNHRKSDFFRDVWLFRQDFDLNDVVLQPGETVDKMYADKYTILQLCRNEEFVPYDYLQELFKIAGL